MSWEKNEKKLVSDSDTSFLIIRAWTEAQAAKKRKSLKDRSQQGLCEENNPPGKTPQVGKNCPRTPAHW